MTKHAGWLVAADDITGAAEVAGAACSMGLRVTIVRDGAPLCTADACDLIVLDTDSRALPAPNAADRVQKILQPWLSRGLRLVYKKVDSVLRGNVLTELRACLSTCGAASAVLLSANPTRGRTIESGELRVDGVPLHVTEFARDPEHPARSSDLRALLGTSADEHEHVRGPVPASSARLVTVDAVSSADVARCAASLRNDQLPAGGVEFFRAWLERSTLTCQAMTAAEHIKPDAPVLTVCGSRSIAGRLARDQLLRCGGSLLQAPHDLVSPRLTSRRSIRWANNAADSLATDPVVVLETGRVSGDPLLVREAVASTVAQVLRSVEVASLLIEGGATASAILSRMGWNAFEVIGEIESGTVALRIGQGQPVLVLKPGTYRWPTALAQSITLAVQNGLHRSHRQSVQSSVIR